MNDFNVFVIANILIQNSSNTAYTEQGETKICLFLAARNVLALKVPQVFTSLCCGINIEIITAVKGHKSNTL